MNVIQVESISNSLMCHFLLGGYYKSDLISHHLITAFVPFLPIEKEQVVHCIRHHLVAKGHKDTPINKIEEIAQQLQFYPNETDKMFSATGCKRVEEKVDYIMGEDKI